MERMVVKHVLFNVFFSLICALWIALFCAFPSYADVVASSSNSYGTSSNAVEVGDSPSEGIARLNSVRTFSGSLAGRAVSETDFVNCVRYDVTISGNKYILLFPSDYESCLLVDSDRTLWNVSGSSITGRLFEGTFDPLADTGLLLTLAPCLGNNFSNNHNYGSPNYVREYYWFTSSGYERLTYDDTYVTVYVNDTYHLYQTGELLTYVVIFLIGCCLICLWKRGGR